MIADVDTAGMIGNVWGAARAWPYGEAREVTPGMLVMTSTGELGEVTHTAFGVVAVRLSGLGGVGATTAYYAVADLTPVLCPADVVTAEEMNALQGGAVAEAA